MWNVETIYIEDEWVKVNDGSIYGVTKDLVRSYELMQSTGLKDFDGVEIFDKDIAKDIDSEELGVVEYDEGQFRVIFGDVSVQLWEVDKNIQIIGNIHQNPELLEGE